ncbi:MAG: preprotein translocase subunit SecA [Candidatus Krumholzibacteria bacterium]|jgi:preprotein translocase subunit SecA|nr:preprotein translocase subunit SecA [Candidatus Krumholzibacteria bacterium]MDP6796799.1 preprotein translocase subunit SecA [Candidatus Krumholzibacteria bacterium]MDP7020920.1 preprotein translocase subunit SecA [Candidatus Krumholzibacteria bacterium]
MAFGFLKRMFGTQMERELRHYWPIVETINEFQASYEALSEEDLPKKTEEFRQRLEEGETLDDLLPEAFALVKEACRRKCGQEWTVMGLPLPWDMLPYDVQLIGGIALHRGNIAEMATGEGKTLVATLPLYLNALPGRGAHLVTVNDYLAQRDSEWMGGIFESLGLSVGVILSGLSPEDRKAAYQCDITYGTNSEFGFDYLRDNMAGSSEQQVQRDFFFSIVDEVDSVLVDEARTPLIISGPVSHSTSNEKYREFAPMVNSLFGKQQRLINDLTSRAETLLKKEDRGDEENWELGTLLLQIRNGSPKAKRYLRMMQESGTTAMQSQVENANMRDKTLHELNSVLFFTLDERGHSIELTEKGLDSLSEKDRGLFVLPDLSVKLGAIDADDALDSRASALAREEAHREFAERSDLIQIVQQLLKAFSIFEKDVDYVVSDGKVLIVDEFTGRTLHGRRYSDGLHQAIEAKEKVTIEGQTQTYATVTLQNFFRMYETLSGMTGTAVTEEEELWEIYKLKVIVIPTNRPVVREDGDDRIYRTRREKVTAIIDEVERLHRMRLPILVGTVSVEFSETLSRLLSRRNIPHNVLNAKQHQREAEIVMNAGQPGAVTIATNMAGRGTDIKLAPQVIDPSELHLEGEAEQALGLQIIGTERHESRRIDRQLRGRSGRQGDPGRSLFFLSLEDNLMRLFSGEKIGRIMDRVGVQEGEVITHPMVTRAIERAQKKVEAHNFDMRKHLLKYDDVMNLQREVVYDRRAFYLSQEDLHEEVEGKAADVVSNLIQDLVPTGQHPEDWDLGELTSSLEATFLGDFSLPEEKLDTWDRDLLENTMRERALSRLQERKSALPEDLYRQVCRYALLRSLDEAWKEHLLELDNLKSGIGLRAYAQKDPLVEFKVEAFSLFESMLDMIDRETLRLLFHLEVAVAPASYEGEDLSRTQTRHEDRDAYHDVPDEAPAEAPSAASAIMSNPNPHAGGRPQPVVNEGGKVGRNDPCPCGSGRKYKKCCAQGTA